MAKGYQQKPPQSSKIRETHLSVESRLPPSGGKDFGYFSCTITTMNYHISLKHRSSISTTESERPCCAVKHC